jgi:anhydro-N-acetylmuramic acid kinase
MDILSKLKRLKTRRILALSAGSLRSGIHSSYIETSGSGWELLGQAFLPYPQKIQAQINELIDSPEPRSTLATIASLDYSITQLFLECGSTTLVQSLSRQSSPHVVILNKLVIWKNAVDYAGIEKPWNLALGDDQLVASTLNVPVFTDTTRHDLYAGWNGETPLSAGYLALARKTGDNSVFINLGLIARMVAVDRTSGMILLDSDAGPGTCLINSIAAESGVSDGFDRDGSFALTGVVHDEIVDALARHDWFSKPAPKSATLLEFEKLRAEPGLLELQAADKMATVTALTARTTVDFFRREYRSTNAPEIWVSGGGAYNQTLIQFLKTYFGTIPVHSIEEIQVNPESCVPLALALSAAAFINGSFRFPSNPSLPHALQFATIVGP